MCVSSSKGKAGWLVGFPILSTTPSQNGQLSTDFYFSTVPVNFFANTIETDNLENFYVHYTETILKVVDNIDHAGHPAFYSAT